MESASRAHPQTKEKTKGPLHRCCQRPERLTPAGTPEHAHTQQALTDTASTPHLKPASQSGAREASSKHGEDSPPSLGTWAHVEAAEKRHGGSPFGRACNGLTQGPGIRELIPTKGIVHTQASSRLGEALTVNTLLGSHHPRQGQPPAPAQPGTPKPRPGPVGSSGKYLSTLGVALHKCV